MTPYRTTFLWIMQYCEVRSWQSTHTKPSAGLLIRIAVFSFIHFKAAASWRLAEEQVEILFVSWDPLTTRHHPDHVLVKRPSVSLSFLHSWLRYHLQQILWQSGPDLPLHLHLHRLCSCFLRLLCLSEAEDLGVQLVAFTVKLDIECYNIIQAVTCGLSRIPQAVYVTLRLGRLVQKRSQLERPTGEKWVKTSLVHKDTGRWWL